MLALLIAALLAQSPELALPKGNKEPRAVVYSERTVDDLAACAVLKLAETRGYEIIKTDAEKGYLVQMRFRVAGVAATAASIYIQDLGPRRRIAIYATGKKSGAPQQFSTRTLSCADRQQ